ncbi:MAG: hypothetical protein L6R42_009663, partial [Xanthoria sp. 1 TBL-2021]
ALIEDRFEIQAHSSSSGPLTIQAIWSYLQQRRTGGDISPADFARWSDEVQNKHGAARIEEHLKSGAALARKLLILETKLEEHWSHGAYDLLPPQMYVRPLSLYTMELLVALASRLDFDDTQRSLLEAIHRRLESSHSYAQSLLPKDVKKVIATVAADDSCEEPFLPESTISQGLREDNDVTAAPCKRNPTAKEKLTRHVWSSLVAYFDSPFTYHEAVRPTRPHKRRREIEEQQDESEFDDSDDKWTTALNEEWTHVSPITKHGAWSDQHVPHQIVPPNTFEGALDTLQPGRWLSTTAIDDVIRTLSCWNSKIYNAWFMQTDDPPSMSTKRNSRSWPNILSFFPTNHKGTHWTLIVIDPQAAQVEFYDSLHDDIWESEAMAASDHWSLGKFKFHVGSCPMQENSSDCGVSVIVCAIHRILDIPLPASYNFPLWRRVLRAVLAEGLAQCQEDSTALEDTVCKGFVLRIQAFR